MGEIDVIIIVNLDFLMVVISCRVDVGIVGVVGNVVVVVVVCVVIVVVVVADGGRSDDVVVVVTVFVEEHS